MLLMEGVVDPLIGLRILQAGIWREIPKEGATLTTLES